MGTMIFNGLSTEDLGIVIQSPPSYEFPSKDYEVVHVDGKSGDIMMDKGSYQNVQRTYYLACIFRPNTTFAQNANALVSWLLATSGYKRLEDTYEPEYYRLAMYKNSGRINNFQDSVYALEVTFDCKPQRFLKSGEEEIELKSEDMYSWIPIFNPTKHIANPVLTVNGSGIKVMFSKSETPVHEDSSFYFQFNGDGIIDSENQDCYNENSYLNHAVFLTNGFPKLYPGLNWICVADLGSNPGTLNKFKIKPMWWTL